MSSERDWLFKQLDSYARKQYGCFVSEMFLGDDQSKYTVCFRPMRAARGSGDQYACRYLEIGVEDVKASHGEKVLTNSIIDRLRQLKSLG